eukprot:4666163-Pyramimonas_sp.AAC.1
MISVDFSTLMDGGIRSVTVQQSIQFKVRVVPKDTSAVTRTASYSIQTASMATRARARTVASSIPA